MSDRLNVGAVDSWTTLNIQAVKHVPGVRSSMAVDLVLHPWHRGTEPNIFGFFPTQLSNIYRKNEVKIEKFCLSLRVWFWKWFYMRPLTYRIGNYHSPNSGFERLVAHERISPFSQLLRLRSFQPSNLQQLESPSILPLNSFSQTSQPWEISWLVLLEKHVIKSQGSPRDHQSLPFTCSQWPTSSHIIHYRGLRSLSFWAQPPFPLPASSHCREGGPFATAHSYHALLGFISHLFCLPCIQTSSCLPRSPPHPFLKDFLVLLPSLSTHYK